MPQLAHNYKPTDYQLINHITAMVNLGMWVGSHVDTEIERMAEWYAEREFGALAIESDALDKGAWQ